MTRKRVSSHNRVRAFALNLTSLIVLAGMICLLQTGEAFAHAQLVKSRPAPRASLKEPPHEVRLCFNEQLEPAFSIATVVNNEGKSSVRKPPRSMMMIRNYWYSGYRYLHPANTKSVTRFSPSTAILSNPVFALASGSRRAALQ